MNRKNKLQPCLNTNKPGITGTALLISCVMILFSFGVKGNDKPVLTRLRLNDTTHNSQIYSRVDMQPQFPGGLEAFGLFLGKNIRYPAEDAKNKVKGKVIVKFVVEQDGRLSNITIVSSPTKAMADEATRVLSLSPVWNPGYQNGHTVRVWYAVPINFSL